MKRALQMTLAASLVLPLLATATAQPQSNPDLNPRPIQFPPRPLTLNEVLAELEKQTGNKVIDRRTTRTNPELKLTTTTFWPTLDAIGKQTGIGFSAHQEVGGGGVALLDRAHGELTVNHSGLFRFAFHRITNCLNEETKTHDSRITIDVSWEPRIQPLFVNVESATAVFGKNSVTIPRETMRSVAGTGATEIEPRIPAPPRAVAKLDSLKGNLRVVCAPKMLEFTFDKIAAVSPGKPRLAKAQEGVQVSVMELRKESATRWVVEVLIANPPGAIVALESYQSWLDNNRIWLSWIDPQTKNRVALEPDPNSEIQRGTKDGVRVSFVFRPRGKTAMPPPGVDATLHYLTPNRVEAFMVPFAFQDLPLP